MDGLFKLSAVAVATQRVVTLNKRAPTQSAVRLNNKKKKKPPDDSAADSKNHLERSVEGFFVDKVQNETSLNRNVSKLQTRVMCCTLLYTNN